MTTRLKVSPWLLWTVMAHACLLYTSFKLTSGNLMLLALLKVGFTSSELMFTFECEMNSIFTKKRRLRGNLSLDTNDKLDVYKRQE